MDKLDFLDGDTPADTTVAAPTPAEPVAEAPAAEPTAEAAPPAEGPARGSDGKFVSKAAEVAPVAAEQAPAIAPTAQAEPAKPPEGFVPISVVQALREQLKQQQQPPQPAPDPYEDFEAYREWQETQQAHERAEWSRQLAEMRYGAETVTGAQQWAAERFATDPQFRERALTSRDPYGFAIGEYQRDQALQLLSDPKLLDQFRAWQAGTGPAPTPQAAAPVAAPPTPVAPPRSITSAPSAGGTAHTPTGPGQAYGTIFG